MQEILHLLLLYFPIKTKYPFRMPIFEKSVIFAVKFLQKIRFCKQYKQQFCTKHAIIVKSF